MRAVNAAAPHAEVHVLRNPRMVRGLVARLRERGPRAENGLFVCRAAYRAFLGRPHRSMRESTAMGLLFRKRQKFGPLIFNFTENGFSSWTIKIGRWSWNSRTRSNRVDLPGPMSWKQDKSRS
jgi:hypothetical protein